MDKDNMGYILDKDEDIEVSENVVESILQDTDVEREEIIEILKTIENHRISIGYSYDFDEEIGDVDLPGKPYPKIDEYDLIRGLKILLDFFIPSVLLSNLEEMKYYQIQTVIEAANPCEVLINL